MEKANCRRRVDIAEKTWIGSKNLGANLHVTTAELTAQLDRQINDIQHELQLAAWVRKLMAQKLATMKKRASSEGSGSSAEQELKVDEPVEAHDASCLEGGPKDWCSSAEKMQHCGVSKAVCDAYLLQDEPVISGQAMMRIWLRGQQIDVLICMWCVQKKYSYKKDRNHLLLF